MLLKIGLTALFVLIVLVVSLRSARRRTVRRKPLPPPQPLLVCPRCGVYSAPGRPCDCGTPPTPRN